MTNTQPNVHPDNYYSRNEAAQALHVDTKTLDRYTDSGAIKCFVRKCNNRRVWKGSDIINCWRLMY